MSQYSHILLTTDLTDHAKKSAQKALDLAKQFGAKLTIMHAVEPLPAYAMGYMGSINLEQELMDQAIANLSQIAKELGIPESDQRIELGSIKACILKAAYELNADLIVVGSHGRHGLERLLGSTASAVLQGAECDVLVVRTHE
jgi:universal stress protein A